MPLEYALQHRGKNPDLGPWKVATAIQAVLKDTLGVDVLPKQRCVRIGRAPFVFNVLVMGETGLGKTTFMNTLFNTDLTEKIAPKYPQKTSQVTVNPANFELKEDNVTLHLSIIDTPGFGDQLNREKNLQPILDYIDTQYSNYLTEENKKTFRQAIPDTRVHAVLYFISPGYGLRQLDIVALKELSDKVNIIPVIAKADTMLAEEREKVKQKILKQIKLNDIKIYSIDHCDEDDLKEELKEHVPFAVMGSQSLVDNGTEKVRGRKYRWGVVEVDNPEHCDFIHLQQMLMNTCLQDLIETTHYKHYALYRANHMRKDGRPLSVLQCDEGYDSKSAPQTEDSSDEFTRKEEEMRQKFVQMVREKEASLRDKEEQLHQKSKQLMAEIEAERRQLEAEEREIDNLLAQRDQMTKKPSIGKK